MTPNREHRPKDALAQGPFVGRKAELSRLCPAVEQIASGRGARRWIVGPPGIGKTWLLEEVSKYASLRHVPIERVEAETGHIESPHESKLLLIDPVPVARVAALDDRLSAIAREGSLVLATSISTEACHRARIRDEELIVLAGLDPDDAFRLLGAWMGSAFESDWARELIRSTRGDPGRMRRAAIERLSSIQTRARRTSGPPPMNRQ